MHKITFRAGLAAAVWACASLAQAAPLSVSFDNFTYSGSVTRYATLADAQGQVNPASGPYTIQTATNETRQTRSSARDGNLSVTSAAPAAYGSDVTYVSTAWYFTTFPANGNGWGNPNNTNDGFIQYYLTSSAPTVSGGWQPGYTQFKLTVGGGNGDSVNAGRFWPAPGAGAAAVSGGEFVDFNLNVTASFLSAATLNGTTNWYESNAMPSGITGTLTGIFHNDQISDTGTNGYYRFNYTVTGPGSWAADNNATWVDGDTLSVASLWAAPAVPVPPTTTIAPVPTLSQWSLVVLSLMLALLVWCKQASGWRQRR